MKITLMTSLQRYHGYFVRLVGTTEDIIRQAESLWAWQSPPLNVHNNNNNEKIQYQ